MITLPKFTFLTLLISVALGCGGQSSQGGGTIGGPAVVTANGVTVGQTTTNFWSFAVKVANVYHQSNQSVAAHYDLSFKPSGSKGSLNVEAGSNFGHGEIRLKIGSTTYNLKSATINNKPVYQLWKGLNDKAESATQFSMPIKWTQGNIDLLAAAMADIPSADRPLAAPLLLSTVMKVKYDG